MKVPQLSQHGWTDGPLHDSAKKLTISRTELQKLQDFFPPGRNDVTASPLGQAPATGRSERRQASPQQAQKPVKAEPRAAAPTMAVRLERPRTACQSPRGAVAAPRPGAMSVSQLEACKAKLLLAVSASSPGRSSIGSLVGEFYSELLQQAVLDVAFEAHRRQSSVFCGAPRGCS